MNCEEKREEKSEEKVKRKVKRKVKSLTRRNLDGIIVMKTGSRNGPPTPPKLLSPEAPL